MNDRPIPAGWMAMAIDIDRGVVAQETISRMCEEDPEFLMFLITRQQCKLEAER